jgi:predicted enzyme related to lactoylglutathione lyase
MSGKEKEGENGWYMYFLDVEGNRFGVYELEGTKS